VTNDPGARPPGGAEPPDGSGPPDPPGPSEGSSPHVGNGPPDDGNGPHVGNSPPDDAKSAPLLAHERTDLAWTRSAISFFALGIAVLKFRPVVGIPLLAFSAWAGLVNRRPPRRDWDGAVSRRLLLVSLTVTGLAVIVLVLTFLGPGSRGLRP